MTISSLVRTVGPIIGNNGFSAFPFAFKVFFTTELSLVATENGVDRALVLGTDYSVVLNPDQNAAPGGTITYRVASVVTNIPVGTTINGTSNVSNLQPVNLTNNGGFFPAVINAALDRLTILVQQIGRVVTSSLQYPVSDGTISGVIPNKATRALRVLGFDVNGLPVASNATMAQIDAVASAGVSANGYYAATSAGTGDAVTAIAGLSAYATGQTFRVLMTAANTVTNPTLNFDGKGAKTIKRMTSGGKGALIGPNEYYAGYLASFFYDGVDLILLNPFLLYAGQASINTGADLTGTDSINTYGQVDSYNPGSVVGNISPGPSTVPGISASTSRGTGIVPANSTANDLIGGVSMYGYIAGAYQLAAAAVGRVVGATAGNLGGQWEVWTKKDNGALTKALNIDSSQNAQFAGDVQLTSVNSNQVGGFRNMLYNGDFSVSQRYVAGTPAWTDGAFHYVLDRWLGIQGAVNSGLVMSQAAYGVGGMQFLCRVGRLAAVTGVGIVQFQQALETRDSIIAAGKQVTLSFYAYSGANFSSAARALGVLLVSGTGTDQAAANLNGGWTGGTAVINSTVNLTTGVLNRYTITGSVPANCSQLGLQFYFTPVGVAGADDSFYIGGVQLEIGPVATPYEFKGFTTELARCQRYYEKSFDYGQAPVVNIGGYNGAMVCSGMVSAASGFALGTNRFATVKRVAPAITLFNPAAANAQVKNISSGADCTASSAIGIGAAAFAVQATSPNPASTGNQYGVHWAADAEL